MSGYTVFDVSTALRLNGWTVPAYRMPPDQEDLAVLRIVVRNGFSRDLAASLLQDLEQSVHQLARSGGGLLGAHPTGFHH